jgi:hypothetical protein
MYGVLCYVQKEQIAAIPLLRHPSVEKSPSWAWFPVCGAPISGENFQCNMPFPLVKNHLFSQLKYSTYRYVMCTHIVRKNRYLVLTPQLGVMWGIRLLHLKACMRMASHPRYVANFSSECMVCGPWVALFTVWWTPGSLLGKPIGFDGYKVSTCILTWSLSPCWVPLLVPFGTCHWVLACSQGWLI